MASNFLLNAIKPSINDQLDKGRKALPAGVAATIATITTWLPASIDKAVLLFKTAYTDLQARVATWLPTTQPWLVKTGLKTLDWAKKKVDAL